MKIMQFIHGLNTGGAETLVKEYAIKLHKRKHDVVILCFDHCAGSPYETLLQNNGIRVVYVCDYINSYSRKDLFHRISNYLLKLLFVRKFIRAEQPDILHTHLPINKYVRFAKPKKCTKIFHTVHSEPRTFWPQKNVDYKAALWLVKKYGMRFICLHDKMRDEVNYLYGINNSIVLNNGIDFSKYNNFFNKYEERDRIGIPRDAFVIGHVGRFHKIKNQSFLVDVFKEIYKNKKNSFLLMIGLGAEEKNIVNKLNILNLDKNYLILKNRDDVPNLLSTMDIFVFPSLFEGLGISLIEAQKMKLPCFISDTIPDDAIISNIVTKISLDKSAKQWSNIILNYKKPKKIILNDEDWNMDNVINKLESIYLGKE